MTDKKPSKAIKRIPPNHIPLESFKTETRPSEPQNLDPKLVALMKQFQKNALQVVNLEHSKLEKQDYEQEALEESKLEDFPKINVKALTRAEFLRTRNKKE
jgi:hypothetical protein